MQMLAEYHTARKRRGGRPSGKGLGRCRAGRPPSPTPHDPGPAAAPRSSGLIQRDASSAPRRRRGLPRGRCPGAAGPQGEEGPCERGARDWGAGWGGSPFREEWRPRPPVPAAEMTLPRDRLDYASQKSRREKGRGPSLLWRKLSRCSVPGLHVPAPPRPGRKCRRLRGEPGLWFIACGSRANSTISPSRSRNASRELCHIPGYFF